MPSDDGRRPTPISGLHGLGWLVDIVAHADDCAVLCTVFGVTHVSVDAVPGTKYHSLKLAGHDVAGCMEPPARGIPSHWQNYFAVDDADAIARKVVAGSPWTGSTFPGPGC